MKPHRTASQSAKGRELPVDALGAEQLPKTRGTLFLPAAQLPPTPAQSRTPLTSRERSATKLGRVRPGASLVANARTASEQLGGAAVTAHADARDESLSVVARGLPKPAAHVRALGGGRGLVDAGRPLLGRSQRRLPRPLQLPADAAWSRFWISEPEVRRTSSRAREPRRWAARHQISPDGKRKKRR
jgi:hypothetical protein